MAQQAAQQPLSVVEDVETGNRFVAYTTKSGTQLDLAFDGEEPWFTQADMARMFGVTIQSVSQHIQVFVGEGELDESTFKDFLIVRREGSREVQRFFGSCHFTGGGHAAATKDISDVCDDCCREKCRAIASPQSFGCMD